MQKGKSYIKDSNDFINKIRDISSTPEGSLLVTAGVVGLYPSIPHDLELEALKKALVNREVKPIPTKILLIWLSSYLKKTILNLMGNVNNKFRDSHWY